MQKYQKKNLNFFHQILTFDTFASDLHIDFKEKNIKIERKEFIIRQIKNILNRVNENLLFIFDNCDNYQSIKDYLVMISFFEKFKIIITTRSSILYEELNSEEIEGTLKATRAIR